VQRFIALIWMFKLSTICFSQDSLGINFRVKFQGEELQLGKEYHWNGQPIKFTNVKFYVGSMALKMGDSVIFADKKAHLVDYSNVQSLMIQLPMIHEFDRIELVIGTDSLDNVSGEFTADLDPINGMYWTWQSGFINLKLEGNSSLCSTRKNEFVYHIGGYEKPFETHHKIEFPIVNAPKMDVEVKLDDLIFNMMQSGRFHLMSPGQDAHDFSILFKKAFSVTNGKD